jgi:hypothetical protein
MISTDCPAVCEYLWLCKSNFGFHSIEFVAPDPNKPEQNPIACFDRIDNVGEYIRNEERCHVKILKSDRYSCPNWEADCNGSRLHILMPDIQSYPCIRYKEEFYTGILKSVLCVGGTSKEDRRRLINSFTTTAKLVAR